MCLATSMPLHLLRLGSFRSQNSHRTPTKVDCSYVLNALLSSHIIWLCSTATSNSLVGYPRVQQSRGRCFLLNSKTRLNCRRKYILQPCIILNKTILPPLVIRLRLAAVKQATTRFHKYRPFSPRHLFLLDSIFRYCTMRKNEHKIPCTLHDEHRTRSYVEKC